MICKSGLENKGFGMNEMRDGRRVRALDKAGAAERGPRSARKALGWTRVFSGEIGVFQYESLDVFL